jgi:hypothetical protein
VSKDGTVTFTVVKRRTRKGEWLVDEKFNGRRFITYGPFINAGAATIVVQQRKKSFDKFIHAGMSKHPTYPSSSDVRRPTGQTVG